MKLAWLTVSSKMRHLQFNVAVLSVLAIENMSATRIFRVMSYFRG